MGEKGIELLGEILSEHICASPYVVKLHFCIGLLACFNWKLLYLDEWWYPFSKLPLRIDFVCAQLSCCWSCHYYSCFSFYFCFFNVIILIKLLSQALMYPLLVACKSISNLRKAAAEEVVDKVRQHSGVLVDQVKWFINLIFFFIFIALSLFFCFFFSFY